MKRPSLLRLSDAALLREFSIRLARNHADSAELLAYLAEIDRRRLYRPAGYSSMYKYCVGHFHFSEAAAYKRIHAARLIRRFSEVYDALAEGRVHLSGLLPLVSHVTESNVAELLTAATHKSRRQIEELIAERFPKQDVPVVIKAIETVPAPSTAEPALLSAASAPEKAPSVDDNSAVRSELAPQQPSGPPQPSAAPPSDRARVAPLSGKSYSVQFTMDQATHDLLLRAQDLLGHRVAPGDIVEVFSRALKAYVSLLERAKFAATDSPRTISRKTRKDSRHVPARVMRAVWERDGGRCTFVSESGHRCEERAGLEFDHVLEYARGGEATIEGIRLRCRAHNQYEAERTYGAEFMRHKREQAIAARELRCGGAHTPEKQLAPGQVFDPIVTSKAHIGSRPQQGSLGTASAGPRGQRAQ